MSAVLVDTHVYAWIASEPRRLSTAAVTVVGAADVTFISVVSFYEIGQKVRLQKWPEMALNVQDLAEDAVSRYINPIALTAQISLRAGLLDWPHRDPFDRMIAATAMVLEMPLVSADPAFDTLPGLRRVW